MTAQTADLLGVADRARLALCLIVFAAGSSGAATAPIYKCFDKNLGLVYTDEPCKDGERLNIRAGDADPAAVAWLERQRDALDQSAAQRLAEQRRTAVVGDLTSGFQYEPIDQRGSYDNVPAYMADYGFASYSFTHHPHQMRPRNPILRRMRHLAPAPTHVVPRHGG